MKLSKFILKILAISLAVSACACLMLVYWEKIAACLAVFMEKAKSCCPVLKRAKSCCCVPDDYADFADV